jgi:lysozyme
MEALRKFAASVVLRRLAAVLVLSGAGTAAIMHDEGSVKRVYLDPVGIPTVCVGHTSTVSKADVGRTFTDAQCAELLKADTAVAQAAVARLVKVPITQGQYDALVSFTFNVGASNLKSSTLLRKLNAGDCRGAAAEFPRWNRAKGTVLPGLTTRRARERATFEPGCE